METRSAPIDGSPGMVEAEEAPGYGAVYSALVLCNAVQLQPVGPLRYWVGNGLTGRGLEIGRQELELLRVFKEPASPQQAARKSSLGTEDAEAFLTRLREFGILAPFGLHSSLPRQFTSRPDTGIFRVPFQDPTSNPVPADFCFFGVPYEMGKTGLPGASSGPDSLRAYSLSLSSSIGLDSGQSIGWFDYDRKRRLLEGATLVDAGNVIVLPGEAPSEIFARTSELVAAILATRSLPIGMGGDHSITAPILRGFSGQEISIVHFDAHSDLEDMLPPEILHHGNVIRRARELSGIQQVTTFGLRGLGLASPDFEGSDWSWTSAGELLEGGKDLLLERLPRGFPVYVTVDLDVLDPIYVPSVGTPLPGGLSPRFLKEMLWQVGSELDVIGMDFVELSPREPDSNSMAIAAEMVLTLAGAVHQRRLSQGFL